MRFSLFRMVLHNTFAVLFKSILNNMLYPALLSILLTPNDTVLSAPVELESITITAQSGFAEQHISGAGIVLKQKDVLTFDQTDVNTVLQSQPGVYGQQEDGWGLRMNIGIRGTGTLRSSRITLMEDGVLTAPAAYSAPEAYYTPVIWKYSNIEVLKGAAQIVTGPQSTGGALNFVTPVGDEKPNFKFSLAAGAFDQIRGAISGEVLPTNRTQLLFGLFHNEASGFHTIKDERSGGFDLNDGYLKLIHHLDNKDIHHLEVLIAGTSERSQQTYLGTTLPTALLTPNERYFASSNDEMSMDRLMTRLGYTMNLKQGFIRADIYRQYVHRNWYKLDKIDAGNGAISIVSILDNHQNYPAEFDAINGDNSDSALAQLKANNRYYLSQGVQLRGQFAQRFGNILLKHETGLRLHYDHADRFQHSDKYHIGQNVFALMQPGLPGEAGNRIDYTTAQSTYYRNTLSHKSLNIQAGFRTENIQANRIDYGSNDADRIGVDVKDRTNYSTVFLPGMSLNYSIKNWNSFAGVHRGFTPAGSKEGVLPELSLSGEAGIQHLKLPINITFFYSAYDRLLGSDAASAGGSGSGEMFNGGAAEVYGFEGQYGKTIKSHKVQATLTATQAYFKESFSSEFDGWGEVNAGDFMPYIPRLQFALKHQWERNRWSINCQLQYLSARKSTAELNTFDLPQSLVINEAISYTLTENVQLKLSIQNVTNTRHLVAARPAGFRTFAPRMALLSINVSL